MEISNQPRIRGLSSLIGNTPLLAIDFLFDEKERTLFAKAENLNMTESIKDRMAFHILRKGFERGHLKPGDAILMAHKLAEELGMGVGISSGANFLGALLTQEDMGPEAVVVTVFPDSNKKYLSTDLLREEPIKDEFLSPRVKLLSVRALKRVCKTCCDPEDCMEALSLQGTNRDTLPECPVQFGARIGSIS